MPMEARVDGWSHAPGSLNSVTACRCCSEAGGRAATHANGEVAVSFPGGSLTVRLADGEAFLTGPAERIG